MNHLITNNSSKIHFFFFFSDMFVNHLLLKFLFDFIISFESFFELFIQHFFLYKPGEDCSHSWNFPPLCSDFHIPIYHKRNRATDFILISTIFSFLKLLSIVVFNLSKKGLHFFFICFLKTDLYVLHLNSYYTTDITFFISFICLIIFPWLLIRFSFFRPVFKFIIRPCKNLRVFFFIIPSFQQHFSSSLQQQRTNEFHLSFKKLIIQVHCQGAWKLWELQISF